MSLADAANVLVVNEASFQLINECIAQSIVTEEGDRGMTRRKRRDSNEPRDLSAKEALKYSVPLYTYRPNIVINAEEVT